ncbi:PREDICTED: matrix metalloproteinase-23 [Ceratotherium simum simum]|uniref:Matrix metalloproteinase-23 n=1 Tax=Ceratotherium simum simum TaxID=73337 RepID=A0ABM0HFQ8_CERSS|nr:PREDICTED: matrix metalloproteinase-23 [Ceratotherium simum simum]
MLSRSLMAARQPLGAGPAGPARHCHSGLDGNGEGPDPRPPLVLRLPSLARSALAASCSWISVPPAQRRARQHPAWPGSPAQLSLQAVPPRRRASLRSPAPYTPTPHLMRFPHAPHGGPSVGRSGSRGTPAGPLPPGTEALPLRGAIPTPPTRLSPPPQPPEHLLPLKGDVAAHHPARVLATPGPSLLHPQAPRRRRYTLTAARLRWDHFNLTYRILSFPRNLLSPSETRRGLAAAFRMWSDVSPFSFREVAPEQPSDLRIGFYPVNHTDCLVSALHHCFDGPTGELAHAFFPPHGGIHFDDSEYWVLGPTRYSWKKGVWLTDLVHVAAHEIGHALGLMHSQHSRALMHLNATLRGWKALSQDELWGLHRLYGCLDRLFVCASWARRGFCDARRRLMKRLCPSSCDFCYEFPFPTVASTAPPPRTKTRLVPEGRNVTFRCGQKILHKKGKVYWYKDQEPLEFSYPGYLALGEAHLSIIANAINEGTYTCVVRRRQRVLSTYSWRVRVRS